MYPMGQLCKCTHHSYVISTKCTTTFVKHDIAIFVNEPIIDRNEDCILLTHTGILVIKSNDWIVTARGGGCGFYRLKAAWKCI